MMNARSKIILISVVVAAIAIAVFFTFTRPQPNVSKITISAVPAAFYLPLFVAHDQQMFQKHGFESEILLFNSVNDQMNALIRGDVDLSAVGSGGMFALQAQSPGTIRMIYGQNNRSYSFLVSPESDISKIEKLAGKKIGTWPSPTPHVFLHMILDSLIGEDNFEIVPIEFRFLGQALKAKEVDALFNTDVFTQQAIESGIAKYLSRYPLEDIRKPFFNGGGVVRRDLDKTKSKVMTAIEAVIPEVLAYIKENPEVARQSLVKHIGVSETVALASPVDEYVLLDSIDRAAAQEVADLLTDAGVVAASIDINHLF